MMRYFSYNEPGIYPKPYGFDIKTVSEEEIRKEFYPFWYDLMCKKFSKDHVDKTYNFEDCLEDWKVVNYAWEVET